MLDDDNTIITDNVATMLLSKLKKSKSSLSIAPKQLKSQSYVVHLLSVQCHLINV